jgi:hypothetical protein
MAGFLRPIALLLSLLSLRSFGASSIETAFGRLDSGYPWRRIAEGVPAVAFSSFTALGGFWIMLDSAHHDDTERTVGAIAAVTGSLMFLDSLSLLFGKSSGERAIAHYREMPATGDGLFPSKEAYAKAALPRFAETSRSSRWVRGGLTLVNAAPYFYYYFSNPGRYRNTQYMGSAMALLALYRILIPSPEEGAASLLAAADVSPLGVALSWRF